MGMPAGVEAQMDGGCRAAQQQREPPRAAIRHGSETHNPANWEEKPNLLCWISVCLTRPLPWNPGASHSIANEHI